MAAWNSRGLRGSTFEELINQTNEQYEQMNLALIQKIPTPITPVKIDQGSRHSPARRILRGTACPSAM